MPSSANSANTNTNTNANATLNTLRTSSLTLNHPHPQHPTPADSAVPAPTSRPTPTPMMRPLSLASVSVSVPPSLPLAHRHSHNHSHNHNPSSLSSPDPSPLPFIPSTSSSPLIPSAEAAAAGAATLPLGVRPRSNSNSSSSSSTNTSNSARPSLLQRRASRSLSLSLPTSPLLMDPTDQPMLVSPSLYPPTLVANNLYLGSQHSLHYLRAGLGSIPSVPPDSIAVLNVAEELAPLSPRTAQANRATHYLHIPMSHAPNLADHLPTALAFIDTHLVAGRPVLVHCMCGVSRSAAVVLAYLMWKAKWGFRTAYEHVKARRNISPNMHLVCQLVEFAMDLELPGDHPPPPPPQSLSLDASPERNNQPTDSPAALLANPPSVAVAAEHQAHSLSSKLDRHDDHVDDMMDVDNGHAQHTRPLPPPPPPPLMDHVAQVMLVATTAAHARAASHPESATSSPPDTPCSFMTAFTSLPTPLGHDDSFGLHPPATPLTAASVDSPMAFASPARPIRRLSAATISTPTLGTSSPALPLASSSSSSSLSCAPGSATPTRLASGPARNPHMSSICSITSSISAHTSLVSPQSAMLDAFPLTDPDLMAATRAGPMSANAKAAAQAQAAVAAAAAVAGSPLGTPRTPHVSGMLTPVVASSAAAAAAAGAAAAGAHGGGAASSRPRSRSNPNIPASYPLPDMHDASDQVPAVPIVPPSFQLALPPPPPTTTTAAHVSDVQPVVASPAPTLLLSKPPIKMKRGTPPPRINTINLPRAPEGGAAATSAPVVSLAPTLPMIVGLGDNVPPVPALPPASASALAYPQSSAPTLASAAPPPPLPPMLAIPPELDIQLPVEPATPLTSLSHVPPVPALVGKRLAPPPPLLASAPTGLRKGMRMQAAAARASANGAGGLAALPPTPRVVEGECPTPSAVGFKGFFRDDDEDEHEDMQGIRRQDEGRDPLPSGELDDDRMDVSQ